MFERLLNQWLNVVAAPLVLTEDSSRPWVRVVGLIAMFPWFLILACAGPIVLGSAVIFLIGMLVEEA